jgi:hypothetical protein
MSDDGQWVFLQGVPQGVPVSEVKVDKPEPVELPRRNPAYGKPDEEASKPGMETDRTNLPEGPVVLQWPATLTEESVEGSGLLAEGGATSSASQGRNGSR